MLRKLLFSMIAVVLLVASGWADPLVTLTNVNPTGISGPPGTAATFQGTLTNTGTTDLVLLYGTWGGGPVSFGWPTINYWNLPAGGEFTGVLVNLSINSNLPPGMYYSWIAFGYYDPAALGLFGCTATAWECYQQNPGFSEYVFQTNPFTVLIDETGTQPPAVPEPASLTLLGLGAAGLGSRLRKLRG